MGREPKEDLKLEGRTACLKMLEQLGEEIVQGLLWMETNGRSF